MANAIWKAFSQTCDFLFAIGRHEFAKRRAKRRIRERVDIDAVEQGLRERFADIA